MDLNKLEALKAVTDFSKTVLSISTTILAALVSYIILQGTIFTEWLVVTPLLLSVAIILSLFGFGGGISGLSKGVADKSGILCCNLGAIVLLLSIISLPFTLHSTNPSIDKVLSIVESSTKSYPVSLTAGNCKQVTYSNDEYAITYVVGPVSVGVSYSLTKQKIVSIK